MKKLIAIVFIVFAVSCTKVKQCYTCQVANQTTEYCGDIRDFAPKDAQGNDMSYYCQPK